MKRLFADIAAKAFNGNYGNHNCGRDDHNYDHKPV